MKIIKFLLPKVFSCYGFRMPAGLPKASFSIRDGLITKYLAKALRTILTAIIAQLPAGELANVGQGSRQAVGVESRVESDPMQMGGHDDKCVDAKVFLATAKVQAVGDDGAGFLGDENGEPFDDGVGQVIDGGLGADAIAFHKGDCKRRVARRAGLPTKKGRPSVGSGGTVGRPCHNGVTPLLWKNQPTPFIAHWTYLG
jgi:hypothetical protein